MAGCHSREKARILLTQFGLIVLFLAAWEIAPRMHWVDPMLTSYPSAIWTAFMEMVAGGELGNHIMVIAS